MGFVLLRIGNLIRDNQDRSLAALSVFIQPFE